MPAGKSILFPIINVQVDAPCGCPACADGNPSPGEACLAKFAADIIDDITELEVEVDGVSLGNLFAHRVKSGLFTFLGDLSVSDGCFTGAPQLDVSDGYWIMLKPLSVGHHTIHWRGFGPVSLTDPNCTFDFPFLSEVSYNLTVVPHRGRDDDRMEASVQQGTWGMVKELYRK